MGDNTIISPQSKFQEDYLNCNSNIIVAGGAMGCLPWDTEFLSQFGWKNISDYADGDLVAVVDHRKVDAEYVFIKPSRYWKLDSKEFYRLRGDGVDFTVSPEHKMLVKEGSEYIEIEFQELLRYLDGSFYMPVIEGGKVVDKEFSTDSIDKVVSEDGKKYCFTTQSGTFVVRENGKEIISGNSSKSYIGLMRHLRWAEDPHYRGYCIRKNSTTLMKASGLFEEALDLYRQYDPRVVPRMKDQRIVFPSGASVSFSHYENDNASELYRGLQLSSAFYDEATDAEERHIWFLVSRLRTKAKMEPSIWLTCNPNPDIWLREWVDWWLYPEGHEKHGLPDPDKNGKERYILRISDNLHWGDSKEELIERYGKPDLPIDHHLQVKPLSITVLLGTVYDNPTLIRTNPNYLASLEALPEIEKQRNLYGNWEARESTSTFFDRGWCEELDYISEDDVESTVRAFDFAGTLRSDRNPSPDYTASVRMRRMKSGMYVVDDVRRHRILVGDWEDFVLDCTAVDPENTLYLIPRDPNPAAKRMADMFTHRLIELTGRRFKKIDTNRSKLDRFRPFSSMAQNGGVQFLKNCGIDFENNIIDDLKFVYSELEVFTGVRKRGELFHDDVVDCMSDAFYQLASDTSKPIGNISSTLSGFFKGI